MAVKHPRDTEIGSVDTVVPAAAGVRSLDVVSTSMINK